MAKSEVRLLLLPSLLPHTLEAGVQTQDGSHKHLSEAGSHQYGRKVASASLL